MTRRILPLLLLIFTVTVIAGASCRPARKQPPTTAPSQAVADPTTAPATVVTQRPNHPLIPVKPPPALRIPTLVRIIEDPNLDISLRVEACRELANYGPAAAPTTEELLPQLENDALRPYLLAAIRTFGPGAAIPLAKAVGSGSTPNRAAAAELLWELGSDAQSAVPHLAKLLQSDDQQSRVFAADVLDALGPYAAAAVPALSKAQFDRNPYISTRSTSALQRLHRADAGGSPAPPLSDARHRFEPALAQNFDPPPVAHPADDDANRKDDEQVRHEIDVLIIERDARRLLEGSAEEQVRALKELSPVAAERADARIALLKGLAKGGPGIRRLIAIDLANLGLEKERARLVLEEAVDRDTGTMLMRSARALVNIDPQNKRLPAAALAGMKSQDDDVRFLASQIVVLLPNRTAELIAEMSKHLRDRSSTVRETCVSIIEQESGPIPRELMANAEAVVDSPGRAEATANDLLQMGDKAKLILPRLLSSSASGDLDVRSAAITVLSRIAPSDPRVIEAIDQALSDSEDDHKRFGLTAFRLAAIRSSAALPDPNRQRVKHVVRLSENSDPRISNAAFDLLRKLGPLALEEIKDPENDYARSTIIHIATVLAPTQPDAVTIIVANLSSQDLSVRATAIMSFAELGESARPHIASLRSAVIDGPEAVGPAVFDTLRQLGPIAAELAEPVAAVAENRENPMHGRATLALARIARSNPKVVPALAALIEHSTPEERSAALDELFSLNTEDAGFVPLVVSLLSDSDNELRIRAVNVLGAQGKKAHSAAGRLSRMVDNEYATVRDAAARALLRVEPDAPALSAAYLSAVRHRDVQVREILAPSVKKLAPEAAGKLVPRLNELAANDPDLAVRSDAVSALKAIEGN